MQILGSNIVNSFSGVVSTFFAASTEQSSATNEPSQSEHVDLTRVSSNDDTPASPHQTTPDHKRKRESREQEQSRGTKVSYDNHTKRLVPNYGALPQDAQPLSVPGQYNAIADWKPHGQPKLTMPPALPSRKGFKPRDTLNEKTKLVASNQHRQNKFAANGQQQQNSMEPPVNRPAERRVSIHNRTEKRTLEDADKAVGRDVKRRMTRQPEIDLTGEGIDIYSIPFGETVGVASQGPRGSQHSRDANPRSMPSVRDNVDPFSNNSFQEHNKWLENNETRHGGSQTIDSGRSASYASQGQRSQRPLVVSSIGNGRANKRSAALAQEQPPANPDLKTTGRLTINLDRGLDEIGIPRPSKKAKTKQGNFQDIQSTNSLLSKAMSKQARSAEASVKSQQKKQDSTVLDSGHNSATGRNARTDEPLRAQFKREETSTTTPPQQKLSRDVRGVEVISDDELVGPSTIDRSRNSSPNKKDSRSVPKSISQPLVQRRAPSPSDIRPTNFTSSPMRHIPVSKQRHAKEVSDVEEDDTDSSTRVSVNEFFSKAFNGSQKGIELVWNHEKRYFHVECCGERVYAPESQDLVTIGKADVNFGWFESRKGLMVFLKGSQSEYTNGKILLAFPNQQAKDICYNHLAYATYDKMMCNATATADSMEKTFAKQREELVKAHQRYAKTLSTHSRAAATRKSLWDPQSDEDKIIYEGDSEEQDQPRLKQKARMRGHNDSLMNAVARAGYQDQDTISPYFHQQQQQNRRSTRKSIPVKAKSPSPPPLEKFTKDNDIPRWRQSVRYPPEGPRPEIIDYDDLQKLDEGEFLNDNIINFELRCIEEGMTPEHRKKVHFFNTFFFSTLSSKHGKRTFNYDAVSRWTKKIDLFNIPYIIVPVNLNYHWFVIVICNMQNLQRKAPAFGDEGDGANDFGKESMDDTQDPTSDDSPENIPANVAEEPENGEFDHFDEDGKATQAHEDTEDAENLPSSRPGTANEKKSKKKPAPRRYDPDEPILITMDSLGTARSTELRYLKQYVCAEALARRGMELDPATLQGMTAKGLPEQPDFHNCGVYLIGYIRELAKNPDKFVRQVLRREIDQDGEFAHFNPSATRAEIRETLRALEKKQDEDYIVKKKAKAAAKSASTAPAAATAEDLTSATQTKTPPTTSVLASRTLQKPVASPAQASPAPKEQSVVDTPSKGAPPAQTNNDEDDDDDLAVEPPRAQQPARKVKDCVPTSSATARAVSPESEMTDASHASDDGRQSSSPPQKQDIFAATLPYGRKAEEAVKAAKVEERDLLSGLAEYTSTPDTDTDYIDNHSAAKKKKKQKKSDEQKRANLMVDVEGKFDPDSLHVLALPEEGERDRPVEIPDSQEQIMPRVNGRTHIRFDH